MSFNLFVFGIDDDMKNEINSAESTTSFVIESETEGSNRLGEKFSRR